MGRCLRNSDVQPLIAVWVPITAATSTANVPDLASPIELYSSLSAIGLGDCRPVCLGAPCCIATHGELWAREVCALAHGMVYGVGRCWVAWCLSFIKMGAAHLAFRGVANVRMLQPLGGGSDPPKLLLPPLGGRGLTPLSFCYHR